MLIHMQAVIRSAVSRTAARFHLTDEDIEDIVQVVNEKLIRKQLARFDQRKTKLSTFVFMVAQSTTLDELRIRARQPRMSEVTDEHPIECEDALSLLLREEQAQLLRDVIDGLTPSERDFILICMGDGFDSDAYAAQHGLTKGAVYLRRHRLMIKITQLARNRLAA